MKIEGKLYIGDNIEISVQNKIIDNIKVYIPSYWKTNDILKIYDTITGYMSTDKHIEDLTEQDLFPLCSCGLLSKLEEYYPYVKNINKTELDNVRIYATNTNLYCEDNTITIEVNYIDSYNPFKIPKLSKRYKDMTIDRDEIFNIALRECIKNSTYGAQIDEYCKRDEEIVDEAFSRMYAKRYLKELEKKYKKYVTARPSTENDSKEKATVKVDNTIDDYTWCFRRIRIHASYGTIDEIKLRIPVVAHSGILNNIDTLRIYDIVTGHATFSQFIDEEKLIKIDKEKYIKKIQSYNLLDALKNIILVLKKCTEINYMMISFILRMLMYAVQMILL